MKNIEKLFKIPQNAKNLEKLWKCDNRAMRKRIENLQLIGYDIINLQDGKGYFIGNADNVRHYVRQEIKRLSSVANKVNVMAKRNNLDVEIVILQADDENQIPGQIKIT